MKLLIDLSDFTPETSLEDHILTCIVVFILLWIIDFGAGAIYGCIGGPIFGPKKYRLILGRHTMDTLSMVAFSVMGIDAINRMGGYTVCRSQHYMYLIAITLNLLTSRRSLHYSTEKANCWRLVRNDHIFSQQQLKGYACFKLRMKPRIFVIV